MSMINNTLYKANSKGKMRYWYYTTYPGPGDGVYLRKISGQVGGKPKVVDRLITKGKQGRTVEEQVESEGQSAWNKKRDREGYHMDGEVNNTVYPMKAQKYRSDKVEFPCYVQEKLNGIRCLVHKVSETELKYTSKTGKQFDTLGHLTSTLLTVMRSGEIWDGEIYNPNLELQEISSAIKKGNENTCKLEFWVYDQITDETFKERSKVFPPASLINVVFVPTLEFGTEKAMIYYYEDLVKTGAEGVIVRNPSGLYEQGKRSWNLLKLKKYEDQEYPIIGYTWDVDGCVIWKCETEQEESFQVVPRGTKKSRKIPRDVAAEHLGCRLTVRYSELSKNGTPQGNPVGITVRDYE